jgi:hypothetical protein
MTVIGKKQGKVARAHYAVRIRFLPPLIQPMQPDDPLPPFAKIVALPPLEYRRPDLRKPGLPPQHSSRGFCVGIAVGVGISFIVYVAASQGPFRATNLISFSVFCMAFRKIRGFGIGLLVSLPLGMMLFFVGCAMNNSFNL